MTDIISDSSGTLATIEYDSPLIRPNKPVPGVYMIDGVYIGASKNIRARIRQHVNDALNGCHVNKGLEQHILDLAKSNRVIPVQILSLNPSDEKAMILTHSEQGRALFNSSTFGRTYRS